jgi:hypothetical protein
MNSHHGFVPTRPDNTQYQILRLMLRAQAKGRAWRHARVLNLSDLRTPKSAELFVKLGHYAADDRHSMFSSGRQAELAQALGPASTPVLRAWGLNPTLQPWAEKALQALAAHPALGVPQGLTAFRHPLPQRADLQKNWLDQVSGQAWTQLPVV